MHDAIHCDVVLFFSTWRTAVSGQQRRGLSRLIDEQVGTANSAMTEPESIWAPRSLLSSVIHLCYARIVAAGVNRSVEVAGDELLCTGILIQTLYHGNQFRAPDRPIRRTKISNLCMTTC
jgi:hypothetical protein